jgi:hypothetical protein
MMIQMSLFQNRIRATAITGTLAIAIITGGYGLKVKGLAGLADLSLNISAAAAGSAFTVLSLEALFQASERRRKQRFFSFFGKTFLEKEFKLICSRRELSNPNDGSCFKYPFAEQLDFPVRSFEAIPSHGLTKKDSHRIVPSPKDVKAWLAYDDMLVAARMGKLFGSMGRQVQIALDTDDDNWNESPTIAVGLGFTLHTWKLLSASGLIKKVAVIWPQEETPSDAIKFNEIEYATNGPEDEDYAFVARVICDGGIVHFICAGRTAPGTAAAGRYLAEKWEEIADLYSSSKQPIDTVSVAVLIKHPPTFERVRNVRKTEITRIDHAFAPADT